MSNELLPKHTVQRRDLLNYDGAINHVGVFCRSGSISDVSGSMTGSVTLEFDAIALRLRRVEVFHSGSATQFNISVENSYPNTGSFFDPRNIVTCYDNIPGGVDFRDGIDQVEDLLLKTDAISGSEGNLYLKFMPYGSGLNDFKYLLFFEAVFLYVDKDGNLNR